MHVFMEKRDKAPNDRGNKAPASRFVLLTSVRKPIGSSLDFAVTIAGFIPYRQSKFESAWGNLGSLTIMVS